MGKISAAKKKERRKDFQKVKFKVGKKLPKNLNETRATFKAKTLILKKQFQLDKEGPVSHRNLTWKELLAHLGHHNQSVKLDAILSLKEMISTNSEIIRLDMNNFLESMCPLFSDREYKVREAAMQLLKTFILLPELAKKKSSLEPFYSLLNVYLSCTMTHIDEKVQHSSLKLLDILVENMPELVRIHAYTIFENFVDQISKASLKDNKRVLKNDPYKMTSTQTWRHNVLTRLYKMLLIVSNSAEAKVKTGHEKPETNPFECIENNWKLLGNKSRSLVINFGEDRQCSIISHLKENECKPSLKICKRINTKKNLTELSEFLETYFKIITPLLIDCWIEAKPENKNIIDSFESLSIMNSVLSILNLLLENLNFDFVQLSNQLRSNHNSNQIKHIEQLFLANFPYCLAENFEYTSDSKKVNVQLSANTINLLLCKFCSSSLLQLTDEKLLIIFKYSLNALVVNKDTPHTLELNELNTVLKLSETIFNNFTNPEIVKPFLIALVKYFDTVPKFSHNKWLVFEFLCRQFHENNNLIDCESIYLSFYKKTFAYCISYAKEKKPKLESLIDWLRRLVIKKEKSMQAVLTLLEAEYINMFNALDFESNEVSDSCKKKLLELIYWLPRINRYLFTKLSILILNKKCSVFNTNQILGILKSRLESEPQQECIDQSDYLMFLTSLFNGYSGFDLVNKNVGLEFYDLDCAKFQQHEKLCQHLEEFIGSHKNSEVMIDAILSICIPIFSNSLQSVSCSTLYGSLSLLTRLADVNSLESIYNDLVAWTVNALFWVLNKIQLVRAGQIGTREAVELELDCLNKIINKTDTIYQKHTKLLNDSINQIAAMLQISNNLETLRKMFVVLNYLIGKYQPLLTPSLQQFADIYKKYEEFNSTGYIWWHEFCNLLKTF